MTTPTDPPSPATPDRQRATQLILGVACGDALGAATEFLEPDEARTRFDPDALAYEGGGVFNFAAGEATDDTQLTVATLCALTGPPAQWPARLLSAFGAWQAAGPPDVGMLTQRALQSSAFDAWHASRRTAAGNGALMRAAAVNAAVALGTVAEEDQLRAGVLQGAATHIDPRSVAACAYLNDLTARLWRGETLRAAGEAALRAAGDACSAAPGLLAEVGWLPAARVREYRQHFDAALPALEDHVEGGLAGHHRGQGGFVLETLGAALAHNVRHADFGSVILAAARGGDDSDTVGAVAGGLAAARGLEIPPSLIGPLRLGHSWSWSGPPALQWRRSTPLPMGLDALFDTLTPR